jgi:hypothetical protein
MASEYNAIDYAAELESVGVPKAQAAAYARILSDAQGRRFLGRQIEKIAMDILPQLRAFKTELDARLATLEAILTAAALPSPVQVIEGRLGSSQP